SAVRASPRNSHTDNPPAESWASGSPSRVRRSIGTGTPPPRTNSASAMAMTGRRGLAAHRATRYFSEVISPVSIEGLAFEDLQDYQRPKAPAQLAPSGPAPL